MPPRKAYKSHGRRSRPSPITSYGIILFTCQKNGRPPELPPRRRASTGELPRTPSGSGLSRALAAGVAADLQAGARRSAPPAGMPAAAKACAEASLCGLKFLLFQRRDTYEYIEFLRGLWATDDEVRILLSLMSREERRRIREYLFDELWDDFWVRRSARMYVDTAPRARAKYASVRPRLGEFLDTTCTAAAEAPYGFPSGRKNSGEGTIECALREFEEETRIDRHDVVVWRDVKPLVENFLGSNGKHYCRIYYVAEFAPRWARAPLFGARPGGEETKSGDLSLDPLPRLVATPNGIRKLTVTNEAYRIGWFYPGEAMGKLDARRQAILKKVINTIVQRVT